MKEIGGYFGLETFEGAVYHQGLLALNTGRNALAYLIRKRNIRKLWIPRFLCDSVSGVCFRCGCEVGYYAIAPDFMPLFAGPLQEGETLYLVNFYGQISNETALALQKKFGRVIFDNVQAFFQKAVPGLDTIYSCRKFFGVPDGAYLAVEGMNGEDLEQDRSMDRMRHVLGRFEDCANPYYGDFKQNDGSFKTLEIKKMSPLTQNLLRGIDYEKVKKKRERNFAYLHSLLGDKNPLPIKMPQGPYAYPFYAENGMALKKALAGEKIFVATLWPNVLENGDALDKDYAENILPLPCDQRYDEEDMLRIVKTIERLKG